MGTHPKLFLSFVGEGAGILESHTVPTKMDLEIARSLFLKVGAPVSHIRITGELAINAESQTRLPGTWDFRAQTGWVPDPPR